jgi:hypothetical protein
MLTAQKPCDPNWIRAATSFCEGKAVGPFLDDVNDKMFASLRSATASLVSALRYTTQQFAAPFSPVSSTYGKGRRIRSSRIAETLSFCAATPAKTVGRRNR